MLHNQEVYRHRSAATGHAWLSGASSQFASRDCRMYICAHRKRNEEAPSGARGRRAGGFTCQHNQCRRHLILLPCEPWQALSDCTTSASVCRSNTRQPPHVFLLRPLSTSRTEGRSPAYSQESLSQKRLITTQMFSACSLVQQSRIN